MYKFESEVRVASCVASSWGRWEGNVASFGKKSFPEKRMTRSGSRLLHRLSEYHTEAQIGCTLDSQIPSLSQAALSQI